MQRIRVGVHNVAPMLRVVIEGVIALADDIEVVAANGEPVDVVLVPVTSEVISVGPGTHAVELCAMRPCDDARSAYDLAATIRRVARRDAHVSS